MKLIRLAIGFAFVACGVVCHANDSEKVTVLEKEPLVLDKVNITAFRERIKNYETSTNGLWKKTEEQKTISYLDVLTSAYGRSAFDLQQALLAKKSYRDALAGKGHDFFCNYGAINVQVPIVFRQASSGMIGIDKGGPQQYVYYSFEKQRIVIHPQLYRTALMHAAGVSLCGYPSPESLERIKFIGAKKEDFAFRRQVNVEVQLQDLNRLYALYSGRPIMTPLDAVEALCMLGERPSVEQIEGVFARNGYKAGRETIAHLVQKTKERFTVVDDFSELGLSGLAEQGPEAFRGASRLLVGFRHHGDLVVEGLRQLGGKEYLALLEKILIEAPGHI